MILGPFVGGVLARPAINFPGYFASVRSINSCYLTRAAVFLSTSVFAGWPVWAVPISLALPCIGRAQRCRCSTWLLLHKGDCEIKASSY